MSAAPDLSPLQSVLPEGLPDMLREVAEYLYMELRQAAGDALDEPRCADLAVSQMLRLSDEFGGVYLPKGVVFRLTPRNRQMCEEFRGDYVTLARKYRLSVQQVRNTVDRWQRERFMARQGDMFGAAGQARGRKPSAGCSSADRS